MSTAQKNETAKTTITVTPAQAALLEFFNKADAPHRLKELFDLDNFIWVNMVDTPSIGKSHTEAFFFHNILKDHLLNLITE